MQGARMDGQDVINYLRTFSSPFATFYNSDTLINNVISVIKD